MRQTEAVKARSEGVAACAAKSLLEGCELAKKLLHGNIELEESAFQQLENMLKVIQEVDIEDVLMSRVTEEAVQDVNLPVRQPIGIVIRSPVLLSSDEAVEAVNTQERVVEGIEDISVVELKYMAVFPAVPMPRIMEQDVTLNRCGRTYRSVLANV